MALITGPLLSLDARGQVAGSLVFSNWKGRPYVRQLVTPSNPKSAGQVATRAMFKFLSQAWAAIGAADKATWEALAAATTISPFNAYVAWNMNAWTQFEYPVIDPNQAIGTNPALGTLTATGGVRQAQLSQVITTPNDIWGMVIMRSTVSQGTGDKTTVVAAVEYTSSPVTYVDTPLAPGTYYYLTGGFTHGGNIVYLPAEEDVVVT